MAVQNHLCLDVQHLHTSFYTNRGIVRAVRDVSFTVEKGEFIGIVGESGSGKTVTCLSVLNLLQAPGKVDSGNIYFDGIDLRTISEENMRKLRGTRMSMIFQDPLAALNPSFPIGWQIAESFQLSGIHDKAIIRRNVIEILEKVKLPNPVQRMHEYSYQFSGGMRQRALIAIALAGKPNLVFADEPTTALDVTVQAEILNLLEELQKDMRMSMVLISHNLNLVGERCSRILVMYAGQIVEEAPSLKLFTCPEHPYTKSLLRALPSHSHDRKLYSIPGEVCNLIAEIKGCAFANRCEFAGARCFEEEPGMKIITEGHYAKCHMCEGKTYV